VGCPHPNPNPHPNTLTPEGTYPKPIPKYSKEPLILRYATRDTRV
jgi:hypothetical protein